MKATTNHNMDHRGNIMTGSNNNNKSNSFFDDNDPNDPYYNLAVDDDDNKSIGTVLDEFVTLLVGENNYFGLGNFLGCFCSQQQQAQDDDDDDDDDNYARYGNLIRSCDSSITSVGTNITKRFNGGKNNNRVIITDDDDDAHGHHLHQSVEFLLS